MSFILDALKKSEAERKRQDAPGIASIPAPTQNSSGTKWIWIIAGLLTINVVVLTGVVLRPSDEADPINTVEPPAMAAETAVEAPPATARRAPPQTRESTDTAAMSSSTAPAIRRPSGADTTPSTPAARNPAEPSGLPTFNELRTAGRLQLPDLHVDIHVYGAQPADRYVFVNMTKYRENAKLSEGPVVTRITPDGVELDYLGTAFLLPRE